MVVRPKQVFSWFLPILAIFFFLRPAPLFAEEPALRLEPLIHEAETNNPALLAARDSWQSAEALIGARGAMPDPQLSYTYFIENIETRLGPQKQIIGLQQRFPFYGKRALQTGIAANDAKTFEYSYEILKEDISLQVKKTFFQLFYLTRAMEITVREKALLERAEETALAKYETGAGNQQNILKVQVELTTMEQKLLELRALRKTAQEKLNKLLGRPPGSPLGRPDQPPFKALDIGSAELARQALSHRPELKASLAAIEKSKEALQLAKKDYFPDLTVGFNYFQIDESPMDVEDSGKDAYNVLFSINLPIWRSKLSSQVKSAARAAAAQTSRHQDAINQVLSEIQDLSFKTRTAAETVILYEKMLIPQAEQSLAAAAAGYQTAEVSFLDYLDTERMLLKINYGYWQAFTDYLKSVADLERGVGKNLL